MGCAMLLCWRPMLQGSTSGRDQFILKGFSEAFPIYWRRCHLSKYQKPKRRIILYGIKYKSYTNLIYIIVTSIEQCNNILNIVILILAYKRQSYLFVYQFISRKYMMGSVLYAFLMTWTLKKLTESVNILKNRDKGLGVCMWGSKINNTAKD